MDRNDPAVMMWKEFRLAKLFGWTPDQIEAAPAHWVDWALAIDREGLGG